MNLSRDQKIEVDGTGKLPVQVLLPFDVKRMHLNNLNKKNKERKTTSSLRNVKVSAVSENIRSDSSEALTYGRDANHVLVNEYKGC